MILLLDIGNTRLKWWLWPSHKKGAYFYNQDLSTALIPLLTCAAEVQRVLVSNVLGLEIEQKIDETVYNYLNLHPEFSVSCVQTQRVRNGYEIPKQLGVDRWLSVLAAYQRSQKEVCVIGAGTAITIDYVDAVGQHLGGYIVPGFNLMKKALSMGTQAVQSPCLPLAELSNNQYMRLGTNTDEAVNHGALIMLEAFMLNVIEHCRARSFSTEFVFTGGDGELLMNLSGLKETFVPDLLFEGLLLHFNLLK